MTLNKKLGSVREDVSKRGPDNFRGHRDWIALSDKGRRVHQNQPPVVDSREINTHPISGQAWKALPPNFAWIDAIRPGELGSTDELRRKGFMNHLRGGGRSDHNEECGKGSDHPAKAPIPSESCNSGFRGLEITVRLTQDGFGSFQIRWIVSRCGHQSVRCSK